MRTHAASLLLLLTILFPALCQQPADSLAGFESLDGLSISYGDKNPPTKLELNTDANFISQGAASVHLSGVSSEDATGNTYLGVSVSFPEPVDLSSRAILFDAWSSEAKNTRALYVRAYDTRNQCALSWNNWSSPVQGTEKAAVELFPGMTIAGFAWESGVAESPNRDEISRLEFIIGTHEKGLPYDIYLDNVRLEERDYELFSETEQAKELFLDTPLKLDDGTVASILCPDGDDWRAVATELQAAIVDKTGLELAIVAPADITDDAMRGQPLVALGAVSNNPKLLYLYSYKYTYADDYFPGPGGYVVQSIHDPWGTGRNVLLIGASDVAGARKGVAELDAALPQDGVVPPVYRLKVQGKAASRYASVASTDLPDDYLDSQQKRAEDALAKGAHTGLFGLMTSVGENYALSRRDGYAEAFAWLAQAAKKHHDSDPKTYGGPWGMDSDFQIHRVLPLWDQVEESPVLTDDQRLEVTKILFEWVSAVGVSKANSVVGNERVRFNHQTFPALGLLFAGEYFTKYYSAVEAKRWTELADAAFQMQARSFKSHEDCNGYQWLTQYHTMTYALTKPDFTFFENGNARRCADYAILSMDNLGYSVTYGDTGAYVGWWSEMPFLKGALWYYRDPRYAWILDKKTEVSGRMNIGEYTVDAPAEPPADMVRSIAWPLDPFYYRTHGGPTSIPEEQGIDKVVFRNGLDPEDQYLLLDGLSNGGHKHLDGNSISRWTENGRIWIADADYIRSAPKYHSGVLILREGQSAQIPGFTEIESTVDLPSFGSSTTVYRDYAGADWHRSVLWLKGKYFLVADRMVALEDGDFSFRVVWNTIGKVSLTNAGMSIEQDGQHAAIAVTPDCKTMVKDDPEYGKNWNGYEFIDEPVVRMFKAVRNVTLKAGEQFTLFSLLHASGEEPSTARLVRIDADTAAVDGLDEPMLVTVGGRPEPYQVLPMLDLTASMSALTPTHLFTVGATHVASGDQGLDDERGIDGEVNIMTGEALIVQPATTTATTPATPAPRRVGAGTAENLRGLIEAAIAAAPPVTGSGAGSIAIPRKVPVLWSYRESLDSYLLTNNKGAFEGVDTGLELTGSDPLPANVFSQIEGANDLAGLVDGDTLTTEGGVMFADDQKVNFSLQFDNEYDISKIVLRAWFATSSSKNRLFQLGELTATASSDGFADDAREIIGFTDTEVHGNWGDPGHAPHIYRFDDLNAKARALRFELQPRPGTAIYIAEIEVWGNREGLEIDYAALKERGVPVHTFGAIQQADLDGDGVDEVIAGASSGKVSVLGADGSARWDFETSGRINDLAAVDFRGDGNPAVVTGSTGGAVTALSTAGEKLWQFTPPYYKRAPHVRVIFPADLEGDGSQAVIAGSDNWHFYAIDSDGQEIWNYESVHGSTCGAAGDVDGDGMDEVIAGTEYYWWHTVRPDGKRLYGYNVSSPHANTAGTAKLDPGAQRSIVFGGADGNVHVLKPDGTLRFRFNTGDEVMAATSLDIDDDAIDEIIAGSLSFNIYAIDHEGNALWRKDLASEVLTIAPVPGAPSPQVLVGCSDGALYLMDARDGSIVAGTTLEAPPLRLSAGRGPEGQPLAVVSTEQGDILALDLK